MGEGAVVGPMIEKCKLKSAPVRIRVTEAETGRNSKEIQVMLLDPLGHYKDAREAL